MNSLEKIKKSAIELLFVKGKFDSTSNDIADFAGVKRPLIYYYFKSVDQLLLTIIRETRTERDNLITEVLDGDEELSNKIRSIFEIHQKYTLKFPFRQVYVATHQNIELNEQIEKNIDFVTLKKLLRLFESGIKNNQIKIEDSRQILLLFVAFLNYPILMNSMGPKLLGISNIEYQKVLDNRKEAFIRLIIQE